MSASLSSAVVPAVVAPVAVAAPAPVAASAVVASAVSVGAAAGGALVGGVLRPSLPARGAAPSGRWVLSFSFSSWSSALVFAQVWSAQVGLFLRVRGSRRVGFSVSVPLVAGPASLVGSSFSPAAGPAAVRSFSARLRGLSV